MFDIRVAKKFFFDRQKIIKLMDAATRKSLSKGGAFIRRRAQTSMKYRKKGKASAPGTQPYAHKGGRGPLLRKFLYFGYDPGPQSVVIGPAVLPGFKPEAAPLNEFGGTASRRKTVRVAGRKSTPAQATAFRRLLKEGRLKQGKQTTPTKTFPAKYPQRAFMNPALTAEIAAGKIPKLWANSIKRA